MDCNKEKGTVARFRDKHGLTQPELATWLGVSRPSVARWEADEAEVPEYLKLIMELCEMYRIPVARLAEEAKAR